MNKSWVVLCIAAGLVCACGQKDGAPAKADGATPTLAAKTDDAMPKRKAGMWEMKMENPMMHGISVTTLQCIDEKTDAEMQKSAMKQKDYECSKQSFKKTSNGFEAESVCKSDKMTVTSKIVASGDFQSAYKMDMTSRMDPTPQGMPAEMKSTINVRYLGATCEAGMKPGDTKVNMPNGQQMMGKMPKR